MRESHEDLRSQIIGLFEMTIYSALSKKFKTSPAKRCFYAHHSIILDQ